LEGWGKEIQSTVTDAAQKNEKVDQSFLSRRFRNIPRMALDVLDIVVAHEAKRNVWGLSVI